MRVWPGRAWLLLIAAAAAPALAADAVAGRQKALACAVCHGQLGLAVASTRRTWRASRRNTSACNCGPIRSGARRHEVMNVMAKPLSDADIDDLVAWFSSLQVSVQPVP